MLDVKAFVNEQNVCSDLDSYTVDGRSQICYMQTVYGRLQWQITWYII